MIDINSNILDSCRWDGPLATLSGRRLVLVVTGGVAAYKAAELARLWTRAGALVRVVLTANASRFITPLTFEALTGQPAYVDMWARPQFEIEHIALANWAEAVVVAPATANFLAKMAWGLADDLASSFLLAASHLPRLAAPAMNSRMLAAPATRDNLDRLTRYGVELIRPAEGLLACGAVGEGRLASLNQIALLAARALAPADYAGRRVVVSAGSTVEKWDDIRFLANRSTGKMGLALAQSFWLRGAELTLLGGGLMEPPEALPQFNFIRAESTRDMLELLKELDYDLLVMAAAPADFRPAKPVGGKIKKGQGPPPLLGLAANPDILKTLPKLPGRLYVGFAAEDDELIERGRAKLEAKNLDLIAANRAGGEGGAFGASDNQLWLIAADSSVEEISSRPKFAAAWALADRTARLKPR